MSSIIGLFGYMIIGGLLMGIVYGEKSRECQYQKPIYEYVVIAAAWPALIGMAMTVGDLPEGKSECGSNP